MNEIRSIQLAQRRAPIVAEADLVVVGGGPAGISAAVSGARNGLSTILIERYPYLGGLASGGMVLVLDDMSNGAEITVRGLAAELIDRMERMQLCVVPPEADRRADWDMWRKWSRWGAYEFHSNKSPQPICYAAAFDPDGFKRASNDMVAEAKVNLRLHSWFSQTIVEGNRVTGVVLETKAGPQAVRGSVIVDATGDLDVAASAGAAYTTGSYLLTTVFRLGGVDVETAERFEREEPEAFQAVDKEIKTILGGAWEYWWMRTPLPGIVWCNCPHMVGFDGTKVEDLTRADFEGRRRMNEAVSVARKKLPGFDAAFIVDTAPQLGVRQSRLLEGAYVVSKEDIAKRRHFRDSVARGRDYYYPYRAMLPRDLKGLLVVGRHYSATPSAQRISREIPPCMAMGEAAGVAAALARESNNDLADIDITKLQQRLRAQGADPGDRPSANATVAGASDPVH
jgi:hypothetical protein